MGCRGRNAKAVEGGRGIGGMGSGREPGNRCDSQNMLDVSFPYNTIYTIYTYLELLFTGLR
jgi:hypothetical protein